MKRTKEDIDRFIRDIKDVCETHRLGIVGTCANEGIYGEITVVDLDDPGQVCWDTVQSMLYNFDSQDVVTG
jgi:hypothetical protein